MKNLSAGARSSFNLPRSGLVQQSAAEKTTRAIKTSKEYCEKIHIAISTDRIAETVADYSQRLIAQPSVIIPNEYALWRTATLNLSVRQDAAAAPGSLRHLGWEDSSAPEFTQDADVNGIVWELFNADHQAEEINELWPDADYQP